MTSDVSLWHGEGRSAIKVGPVTIEYTQRTHKYRSEADYQALVTELRTYGAGAAMQVLAHLEATR